MALPRRTKSLINQGPLKVGTWNLNGGLKSQAEKEIVMEDLNKLNIDIVICKKKISL